MLKQTQLIRRVLNPAVRFWLKTQVEALESLDFELSGSDRQLLAGQIPKVRVAAEQVIYQGIPLTQIAI
ncbi:MAG: LmeA family phospholipid-binding protein, partial [Cyanobacteria bacterium P01_H01_bin.121]